MSTKNRWLVIPSHDLGNPSAWTDVAPNTHGIARIIVLIRESRGNATRLGPEEERYTVGPNDKVEVEQTHERLISEEEAIAAGVKYSILSKLTGSLVSKASAALSSPVPFFASKLGAELQTTVSREITESIERTAGLTSSYKIEVTDRSRHTITLNGGSATRVAALRRRYWPRYWDIYVFSWEYLEVVHKRDWTIYKIRSESKRVPPQKLAWPICRLTFHEPQPNKDITYEPVTDELTDPEAVLLSRLVAPMPSATPPELQELSKVAAIAFPGNRTERAAAAAKRPPAKKAVAKKVRAKKAASQKASTKKAPAKKAVAKKAVAKKVRATKASAKKAPAKKAASQKASTKKAPAKKAAARKAPAKKAAAGRILARAA